MNRLRTTWVLGLIAVLVGPACGQDFSTGLLDRDAVIEAAASVTLETYPNADEVLVDDHIRVDYNADGTCTRWDDTVIKVLTEAGKRNYQSLSFYFMLPYYTVDVTLVEVIKPDGTIVPVDIAAQSAVQIDPYQTYMNIYDPNDKVLTVGVPDLEVGDLVRYVFCKRTVKALMPGHWCDFEMLEYTAPIKRFVYEVFAPTDNPLERIVLDNEIEGTVTYTTDEQDGRLHHRWEAANVPRMFFEPSMPMRYTVVQRVLAGTIPDWETVSRWYWNVCERPINATTPDMEAKVAELTEGLDDRQAKIEAIFYWVAQQVRYMGITTETEAPGHEPHDVSVTFENKYGVCRDKAALLVAMLRLAGFDAQMVSIHAGAKLHPDAPRPYFNHAIVGVREEDGSWQLMDCTSETTKQLLPAYLSDRSYVVSTADGEGLATSPIVPAEQNLCRIDSTGTLSPEGALTLRSVIRLEGYEENWARSYFTRIKPEQRRQYFERSVKEVIPGATVTRCEITPVDMQDTSQPIVVTLDVAAADFLIAGDDCRTMQAPFLGGELGIVHYLLYSTGLAERRYPLRTNIACGVRETFRINLPPGFAAVDAAMPAFVDIEEDALTWRKSLALDGLALTGSAEFFINVVEFSPEQYLRLRDHLRTIEFNERKMPIFTASSEEGADLIGPEDDIIILAENVVYDVADAHTWTERRTMRMKVLTQSGREKNAELTFDYNPAWEAVELVSATVTSPDGTVKTISDEEINLMDADWVSDGPRYPAGKQLVASLPGVEVGSVIEYDVIRECRDRPFFAMAETFGGFDPVAEKVVALRAPADLNLTVLPCVADELKSEQASVGARVSHTWTITDQPGRKREYLLAPSWTRLPTVIVSAGDWATYAEQVGDTLESAVAEGTDAAAKARGLTDGLTADEAKILAVRNFVARSIRLVECPYCLGANAPTLDGLPLTAITAADRVLADGYGNVTDRAVLTAAMLRAIGFEAAFVLASQGPVVDELNEALRRCPETDTFPEVLVRVACDGRDVYINDQDQYGAFGATMYDQALGLDVASGQLVRIESTEDRQDREYISYHIQLADNGDARIDKVRRWYGVFVASVNRTYTEMTPEERRREHLEAVARIAQSARPDGEFVTDFSGYPGEGRLPVFAERYAVRDGDYFYLTLPSGQFRLRLPGTDTRTHDVYWRSPDRQTYQVVVELPEDFADVLLAPAEINWVAPAGGGSVTCRVTQEATPARLVIDYEIDLKAAVIPAEEYDHLLEIQRLLSHPRMRTIVLRRSE